MKIKRISKVPLTIGNGVIEYSDNLIQIKNITKIACGKLPVRIPYFKLGSGLLLGFTIFKFPSEISIIGLLIIFATLGFIGYYIWLKSFSSLNFQLASSDIIFFDSQDKKFLEECYNKVKNIIENDIKGEYIIFDFSNSTINDSTIQVSKGNIHNFKDVNNSIIGNNISNSQNNVNGGNHHNSNSNFSADNNKQSANFNQSTNIENVIDSFNQVKSQITNKSDIETIDKIIESLRKNDTKNAKSLFLKFTENTTAILKAIPVIGKLFGI